MRLLLQDVQKSTELLRAGHSQRWPGYHRGYTRCAQTRRAHTRGANPAVSPGLWPARGPGRLGGCSGVPPRGDGCHGGHNARREQTLHGTSWTFPLVSLNCPKKPQNLRSEKRKKHTRKDQKKSPRPLRNKDARRQAWAISSLIRFLGGDN